MNYFSLKMHQIWRFSFFMIILTKKLTTFSYYNCHTNTDVSNFMHFQVEMVRFFLKMMALRSESGNYYFSLEKATASCIMVFTSWFSLPWFNPWKIIKSRNFKFKILIFFSKLKNKIKRIKQDTFLIM